MPGAPAAGLDECPSSCQTNSAKEVDIAEMRTSADVL